MDHGKLMCYWNWTFVGRKSKNEPGIRINAISFANDLAIRNKLMNLTNGILDLMYERIEPEKDSY